MTITISYGSTLIHTIREDDDPPEPPKTPVVVTEAGLQHLLPGCAPPPKVVKPNVTQERMF